MTSTDWERLDFPVQKQPVASTVWEVCLRVLQHIPSWYPWEDANVMGSVWSLQCKYTVTNQHWLLTFYAAPPQKTSTSYMYSLKSACMERLADPTSMYLPYNRTMVSPLSIWACRSMTTLHLLLRHETKCLQLFIFTCGVQGYARLSWLP